MLASLSGIRYDALFVRLGSSRISCTDTSRELPARPSRGNPGTYHSWQSSLPVHCPPRWATRKILLLTARLLNAGRPCVHRSLVPEIELSPAPPGSSPDGQRSVLGFVQEKHCCRSGKQGQTKQDGFYHGKSPSLNFHCLSNSCASLRFCSWCRINQPLQERFHVSWLMQVKITPDISLKALRTAPSTDSVPRRMG